MTQLPMPLPAQAFDGETYSPERDYGRLSGQLLRVFECLLDVKGGGWRTLAMIASACGCSEASASARLRDLRKLKYGAHKIEREYMSRGVWRYRLAA